MVIDLWLKTWKMLIFAHSSFTVTSQQWSLLKYNCDLWVLWNISRHISGILWPKLLYLHKVSKNKAQGYCTPLKWVIKWESILKLGIIRWEQNVNKRGVIHWHENGGQCGRTSYPSHIFRERPSRPALPAWAATLTRSRSWKGDLGVEKLEFYSNQKNLTSVAFDWKVWKLIIDFKILLFFFIYFITFYLQEDHKNFENLKKR